QTESTVSFRCARLRYRAPPHALPRHAYFVKIRKRRTESASAFLSGNIRRHKHDIEYLSAELYWLATSVLCLAQGFGERSRNRLCLGLPTTEDRLQHLHTPSVPDFDCV